MKLPLTKRFACRAPGWAAQRSAGISSCNAAGKKGLFFEKEKKKLWLWRRVDRALQRATMRFAFPGRAVIRCSSILAALALPCLAAAQDHGDLRAIRAIPQIYAEAWGRGDAATITGLMADNVDIVTASATLLHGRDAFKSSYLALRAGRLKDAALTPVQLRLRFLSPTLCLVTWTWRLQADRNDTVPPRTGLTTMLIDKSAGTWRIQLAQDTQSPPGQIAEIPSEIRKP